MSKVIERLNSILNSLNDIDYILDNYNTDISIVIKEKVTKPAIRMHIIKIAEQFNKLKDENEFQILEKFDRKDLRGLTAIRNFIAHNYDLVDDSIIDDVLKYNFPKLKECVVNILKDLT